MWLRVYLTLLLVTVALAQSQLNRRRGAGRGSAAAQPVADTPTAGSQRTASRGSNQFGSRGAGQRRQPEPARAAVQQQPPAPATAGGSRFQARTTAAPDVPAFDTECPEKNGFFADAFQCDRYYECRDFVIKERLCADGLVFNDYSTAYGRCDQPFSVNCTGREQLQPAKPQGDCVRQNGYFPDPNPKLCGRFIFCVDGVANRIDCPDGLVFSLVTGTCQWPDQAGRTDCSSEEVLSFQCPSQTAPREAGQLQNPRYADPGDCQYFFSCLDGVVPRRHGCPEGRVFNDVTKQCDDVANVPECAYDE